MTLGTTAPEFSLPSVDGSTRSLSDYRSATVLALVQSCNHCPYVQAWEGRMNDLQRSGFPQETGADRFLVVLLGRAIHANGHEVAEQSVLPLIHDAAEPARGDHARQLVVANDLRLAGRGGRRAR